MIFLNWLLVNNDKVIGFLFFGSKVHLWFI